MMIISNPASTKMNGKIDLLKQKYLFIYFAHLI